MYKEFREKIVIDICMKVHICKNNDKSVISLLNVTIATKEKYCFCTTAGIKLDLQNFFLEKAAFTTIQKKGA